MKRSTRSLRSAVCATIEMLESRNLLSSTPTLDDGVIIANGTKGADTLSAMLVDGELAVTMNGVTTNFDLSEVTGLQFNGKKGNDTITIDSSINLPVTLLGDKGNDSLYGGDGNDFLNGGKGRDSLEGGNGEDSCQGGAGNDDLDGGADDDTLLGEAGSDDLNGDDGNDQLNGGKGKDNLSGGAGDDELEGGDDADELNGESGNDSMMGGKGKDNLRGGDDDDFMDGGRDDDTCDGEEGDDSVSGGEGDDDINGGDGYDTFDEDDDLNEQDDRDENEREDLIGFTDLPVAVQNAFNTTYPNTTVLRVKAEDEDGVFTFKIKARGANNLDIEAHYLENGTPAGSEIEQNEVPQEVLTEFNNEFPGATIFQIESDDGGYEFKFGLDGKIYKAFYSSDAVLREATLPLSKTPQVVQDAFAGSFPNSTILRIKFQLENDQTTYQFKHLANSQPRETTYDAAGQVVEDNGDQNGGEGGGE